MFLEKMTIASAVLLSLCHLGWLTPAHAQASSGQTVFRVGKFDRSSDEFSHGVPKRKVEVTAKPSLKDGDWNATQPAVAINSNAQSVAPAESTINFSLSDISEATYRLHVALLVESQNIPSLGIRINGVEGRFFPQPELDDNLGDRIAQNDAVYSHADIEFAVPAGLLKEGANQITLRAISETVSPAPGAALTYDAIELVRVRGKSRPERTTATAIPTIFYTGTEGSLKEVVGLLVRYTRSFSENDEVKMVVSGTQYTHRRERQGQFGEELYEFTVPEFKDRSPAQISWINGGKANHSVQVLQPKRKWTVFLIPHIHLDVGFTDYQAKVAAIQSRVIDEALDFNEKHPEFRFSIDGSWNLEQFLKTRTSAEHQRAVTAIKAGTLFVPAQYANILTGLSTGETLIRSLYFSANFSREHGTPFDYANITDVPSYSWSYASILAAAGINYFAAGSNNHRAPVLFQGHLNEKSPFWWEGPDGQKVLFWYSRHYMQMRYLFGVSPVLSAGHDMLPLFLQQYDRPDYKASSAIIFGTQVENTDLFPQQAELAKQWNDIYTYPRMQYSGFKEALKTIEEQSGSNIPTVRGDGGPYWELGLGGDAAFVGIERENGSLAPAAEMLATLTTLVDRHVTADKASLNEMWKNMLLMEEHTWTAANSVIDPEGDQTVEQLTVKDATAVRAHDLAISVMRGATATLTDSISAKHGDVVVFNTLPWRRSAPVNLDVNKGEEIVDKSSNQIVPLEVLSEGNRIRKVRFLAEDVPSVGYKVFSLRKAATAESASPSATTGNILENDFYRIEIDPTTAAIRSIYDKTVGKEMVDGQSPYRFGQYLYVTGGDREPNGAMRQSWYRPAPSFTISGSRSGRLISVQKTPTGMVARLESTATNTPKLLTEIRLFDHDKKIEFVEDVDKQETTTDEAVYFAFPFAMHKPQFSYEIQTGTVNPQKDMYAGAGHEWFSVQHWVSVQQDGVSGTVMPLDVPLATLGDIDRGAWPRQFGDRTGTIFSFAMNNYWEDNYRAGQGGRFKFRFVVTTGPTAKTQDLSRLGWQEATPFATNVATQQDKALDVDRELNGVKESFLQVSDPALFLQAWKPAEDGNGTILRFLNLSGDPKAATITSSLFNLKEVILTDAVERDKKSISISSPKEFQLTAGPRQIVTVRLVEIGK